MRAIGTTVLQIRAVLTHENVSCIDGTNIDRNNTARRYIREQILDKWIGNCFKRIK